MRRDLARQMALEAELLRQKVHQEAEATWAKVEARWDAEPGSPEWGALLTAVDQAVTAMDRQARVFGLDR